MTNMNVLPIPSIPSVDLMILPLFIKLANVNKDTLPSMARSRQR